MKNKLLIIAIVMAMLPTIKCSSGSSTASEPKQEPSPVQISHNIPTEVLLTEIPFVAEFILEMPNGSTGDIAYHVVQASEPSMTYLPNGVMYQELSMELDLTKQSTSILVAAANNIGVITRVNLEVILNTDCVGCDLSCKEPDGDCATFFNIDFSGADLSYATLRGQHLAENNFSYANLIGTDFSSDLSAGIYTQLVRASFRGADLYLANFEGTFDGDQISIADSIEWAGARCPDGSYADDHDQTCIGHL